MCRWSRGGVSVVLCRLLRWSGVRKLHELQCRVLLWCDRWGMQRLLDGPVSRIGVSEWVLELSFGPVSSEFRAEQLHDVPSGEYFCNDMQQHASSGGDSSAIITRL